MQNLRLKFTSLKLARRIQLNKRTRWFITSYFIELIVVMVGVTSGFALNNWAEGQKDKRIAREYIETLRSDLESDMEKLLDCDSVNQQKIGEMTQLLVILLTNNREEMDMVNALVQNSIENIPFFHPSKTAYEGIRQAGQVRIIRDLQLKNDLIDLYESQYVELRRSENMLLENIRDRMIPFIMENFEVTEFKPLNADTLYDYRFTNLINLIIQDLSSNLKYYKQAYARCQEIMKQLSEKEMIKTELEQ